jgi:hypothetical protein
MIVTDMREAASPETAKASQVDRKEIVALWGATAAIAGLGTYTLFMAEPGLGWGLWTAASALALLAFVRSTRRPIAPHLVAPVALAIVLAFGAAVTATPYLYPLIVLSVVALLAVSMLLSSGDHVENVGGTFIAFAPVVALLRAAGEVGDRTAEAATLARAERSLPVLRGAAIALPVVVIFALMLANADPTLAGWREGISRALAQWSFLPRTIFFLALSALLLGTYGAALRPREARIPIFAILRAPRLGVTERTIILGSVAALFALFLVLQLSYLFGNAPAVPGSGITFAEYARRGFGELTVVATLCTLLIIAVDPRAERAGANRVIRLLELVVIAELQLLLLSAYHRVNLYAGAYGYTVPRLYAQVYMMAVSVLLLMLAHEVWRSLDLKRLVRRGAMLGGATLAALTYWNHEAWIARQNLERYRATGKIDIAYLASDLSLSAVPELARSLGTLLPSQAIELSDGLFKTHARRIERVERERWFEWNLARRKGARALAPIVERGSRQAVQGSRALLR